MIRLICTSNLQLESRHENDLDWGNNSYAILSHTWREDEHEVNFQEFSSPESTQKAGMTKIKQTCQLARERGLKYAWVDTCCIDKSSSSELGESINSMFRWYQKSKVCFVYLEDFTGSQIDSSFKYCRWFTRGWTLQELLAPRDIVFYNKKWESLGTKEELGQYISDTTRIPQRMLLQGGINDYSIAQKMSWASERSTRVEEDNAYCLLGIFDVNMPLIYGEGIKSFTRLQEEIMKRSNDTTLFAWVPLETDEPNGSGSCSIIASTRKEFRFGHDIKPYSNETSEYAITNVGLKISTALMLHPKPKDTYEYVFPVGFKEKSDITYHVGVSLTKIQQGVYIRKTLPDLHQVTGTSSYQPRITRVHALHIITPPQLQNQSIRSSTFDGSPTVSMYPVFRDSITIHKEMIPYTIEMQHELETPLSIWDHMKKLFYCPSPRNTVAGCCFVLRWGSHSSFKFCLLLDFRTNNVQCVLLEDTGNSSMLFLFLAAGQSITWPSVGRLIPELEAGSDSLKVRIRGKKCELKAQIMSDTPGKFKVGIRL